MNRPEPLYTALRRQGTYAFAVFVGAAILLETVVPGTVLPLMDIVPWAVVAGALLLYDAARRPIARRYGWIARVAKILCAFCVAAVIFVMRSWDGGAGMVAAGLMTVGIVSLAFWPEVVE